MTTGEVFKTSILFSIASIFMILVNKGIAHYFSNSMSFVLIFQNVFSLGMLKLIHRDLGSDWDKMAIQWIPCALFFCINIFTSMKALAYINVPTFTLFRNSQPIFTVWVDLVVRKTPVPSPFSLFFLFCIMYGAFMYALHDLNFDWRGYVWAMLHIVSMCLYAVLVKLKTHTLELKPTEMAFYNNALSIPAFLLLCLGEDVMRIASLSPPSIHEAAHYDDIHCIGNWKCVALLGLSMPGSFTISVLGFQTQTVLSPVSYLTLNNISKIPAIVIAVWVWNTKLSAEACLGLGISLISSYFYALSHQDLFITSLNFVFKVLIVVCFVMALGVASILCSGASSAQSMPFP